MERNRKSTLAILGALAESGVLTGAPDLGASEYKDFAGHSKQRKSRKRGGVTERRAANKRAKAARRRNRSRK